MKELFVIKIGGHVIDDEQALNSFLNQFAQIKVPKILIHGGGKIADQVSKNMGIAPNMIEGRRVTDAETLKVVTMVYGGLVNKRIVAKLQSLGCNALGMTGADGNLLSAKKRPVKEVDYGFVGDVTKDDVNQDLLKALIDNGLIPVIPALTHDGSGNLLNTNADTMASVVAQRMVSSHKMNLIYCFEQPGVLKDIESKEVIQVLNKKNTEQYINEGVIHSGMLPKLKNAFEAKASGVNEVRIGFYGELTELINQTGGTCII